MLDIKLIEEQLLKGEKISTGYTDLEGKEIFLGDYLENISYSPLTYQIRIRQGKFVRHTGGSYVELNETTAKQCKINNDIKLKYGNLFNDQLIA